ncbi:MAG: Transposase like [Blastocatellia bacterium]|jgi:REP element-mobilizing transposase RayT|nr:Transposase like [Blastocatellia bacterium]
MPHTPDYPLPRRYNSLRLLGYGYDSVTQLCAITLVTEFRRPLFADIVLAKSILTSLLDDTTLDRMRVTAFTLMPDHLHFLAGVRHQERYLPDLIGRFKSYTTQQYWKRGREVMDSGRVCMPPTSVNRMGLNKTCAILVPLREWRATLRPEVVKLRNWPRVQPEQFRMKGLWQTRLFDHVIRNETDLRENLEYIAMNSVRAGYVTRPQFYPFTGFMS